MLILITISCISFIIVSSRCFNRHTAQSQKQEDLTLVVEKFVTTPVEEKAFHHDLFISLLDIEHQVMTPLEV